jgi:patatin-like phospholipase/acyl hydrolase
MGEKKLKRILSLDGGGIRGILTGKVLEALEDKLNKHYIKKHGQAREKPIRLGEYFDLIAGTSTGGILTCMLLCPHPDDPTYPLFSAKEAVDMYLTKGNEIFRRRLENRLLRMFGGFGGAKFTDESIEDILKFYLKEAKLSQMLKPCLITTYDIQERQAVFFTSFDAKSRPEKDFPMWQVARSTSAAPTYFPPARALRGDGFMNHTVDGGLFANNPTMCAFIEALKIFRDSEGRVISPDQMLIVSIGTGAVVTPYNYDEARSWGILKWLKPVLEIMMSGVSETVDYQMRKLFRTLDSGNQYFRIMPELGSAKEDMDLTTGKNLEALHQAGIKTAEKEDEALERIAKLLIDNQ